MSDDRTESGALGDGGLIDVTGFEHRLKRRDRIDDETLGKALDHILAVSDNNAGLHGFNNII